MGWKYASMPADRVLAVIDGRQRVKHTGEGYVADDADTRQLDDLLKQGYRWKDTIDGAAVFEVGTADDVILDGEGRIVATLNTPADVRKFQEDLRHLVDVAQSVVEKAREDLMSMRAPKLTAEQVADLGCAIEFYLRNAG